MSVNQEFIIDLDQTSVLDPNKRHVCSQDLNPIKYILEYKYYSKYKHFNLLSWSNHTDSNIFK